MKILISPYSRPLHNGKLNPKNYPYWGAFIEVLKKDGHEIIQIGSKGEKQLVEEFKQDLESYELICLLDWCDVWISVDNFFQHFAENFSEKRGIVIWGKSDPQIFGYKKNVNLLRDREFLRKDQFNYWENEPYDAGVFVDPTQICLELRNLQQSNTEDKDQ